MSVIFYFLWWPVDIINHSRIQQKYTLFQVIAIYFRRKTKVEFRVAACPSIASFLSHFMAPLAEITRD